MAIKIFNISVIFILSFLFFISFTWIGYTYEGTENSFREAVTSTLSFLGVLATLTAAYVASRLFNDWRDQHNKSVRNQFSIEAYKKFSEFDQSITLCGFDIDVLQAQISKLEFHIRPGTPHYLIYEQSIKDILDQLSLVKLNFSDYISLQRSHGAVIDQVEITHKQLSLYISKFSKIRKSNLNSFDNIQDFINMASEELLHYSNLSIMIYESDIQKMLKSLQAQE